MKFAVIIIISAIFSLIEFLLLAVMPSRTNKLAFIILLFIAFLVILFAGIYAIYKLGEFWNIETYVKIVLGICCNLVIFAGILYGNMK